MRFWRPDCCSAAVSLTDGPTGRADAGGAVNYGVGPVANTRAAIGRIQQIDPALGSVLAIDPTAITQAQRVASLGLKGPLAGQRC